MTIVIDREAVRAHPGRFVQAIEELGRAGYSATHMLIMMATTPELLQADHHRVIEPLEQGLQSIAEFLTVEAEEPAYVLTHAGEAALREVQA